MQLLIDTDILLYRIGFACQSTFWQVYSKEGDLLYASTNKEDKKLQKYVNKGYTLEKQIITDPAPIAIATIKRSIQQIIASVEKEFMCSTTPTLCISPRKTFRDKIATTWPYKGNRSADRPVLHTTLAEWVMEQTYWQSVRPANIEADDYMAIKQSETTDKDDSVIASIDKDLMMVEGWHYNFVEDEFKFVTKEEGDRWFYTQLLMGDPVDNIHGIKGVGKVKADKLLGDIQGKSKADILKHIKSIYTDHLYSDKNKIDENEIEELITENARLLWMQRSDGDLWRYEHD